jgi:hypothetical protein
MILDEYSVSRYLRVKRTVREERSFRQARRGRPGPETAYRKIPKRRFDIEWSTDEQTIAYDHKSDGMYPRWPTTANCHRPKCFRRTKASP